MNFIALAQIFSNQLFPSPEFPYSQFDVWTYKSLSLLANILLSMGVYSYTYPYRCILPDKLRNSAVALTWTETKCAVNGAGLYNYNGSYELKTFKNLKPMYFYPLTPYLLVGMLVVFLFLFKYWEGVVSIQRFLREFFLKMEFCPQNDIVCEAVLEPAAQQLLKWFKTENRFGIIALKYVFFKSLICFYCYGAVWVMSLTLQTEDIYWAPKFLSKIYSGQGAFSEMFPVVVTCKVWHTYGSSSSALIHDHNVSCVFPLMTMYGGVYIGLWFWFAFTLIHTVLDLLWTLIRFCSYQSTICDLGNFATHTIVRKHIKLDGAILFELIEKKHGRLVAQVLCEIVCNNAVV